MRYFLSRYNRTYSFLMHKDIRVLYGALVITHVGIMSVWFFVWYKPMHSKIMALGIKEESANYLQEYDQYKKKVRSLTSEIAYMQNKQRMLATKTDTDSAVMRAFCDMLKSVGIDLEQCTLSSGKTNKDYDRYCIDATIKATMMQLSEFFNKCFQESYAIRCEQLHFTHESKEPVRMVLDWYAIKKSPSTLEKS